MFKEESSSDAEDLAFEAERQREREEQIKEGIWQPKIFEDSPEVICAASTKEFPGLIYLRAPERLEEGIFNPNKIKAGKSLARFLQAIDPNFRPEKVVCPELAHSTSVRFIGRLEIRAYLWPKRRKILKTDGLITQEPDVILMVLSADCPPVGVYDPRHKAIGVFHSGWKSTAGNIIVKGLEQMRSVFGTHPRDIYAVVGPGISSDYEVGEDVYQRFLKSRNFSAEELAQIFQPKDKEKYNLSLHQAILLELLKAGVSADHIEITSLRTDLDKDLFPSHRREGEAADRFAFIMALK